MKILIRNKSASKIQSKWKKWKLENNPTTNEKSFMQKIFTFFKKINTFRLFDCALSSMCAEMVMRKWH